MAEQSNDAKRFSELLPFYVNQTLGAADQAWMEQQLSERPHAQQALLFEQLIRQTVQGTRSQVAESVRLERMLTALKDARSSQKAKPRATWFGLGGLSRGLAWGARLAIPVPVALALGVLFLGEAVYVVRTQLPDSSSTASNRYRSAMAPCTEHPTLRLQFKADARMEDIILLLRKAGATLKDGPSDSGEVWVSIAPEHATQEARTVLKSSAIVENVMILPPGPATSGCEKK